MTHPVEKYVGTMYRSESYDCADLVEQVRREVYGHQVFIPSARPRGVRGAKLLGDLSKAQCHRVEEPNDGDLVLMRDNSLWHCGLHYRVAHEDCILHNSQTFGCVLFMKVRDIINNGLVIEGYYSWNTR